LPAFFYGFSAGRPGPDFSIQQEPLRFNIGLSDFPCKVLFPDGISIDEKFNYF
jgi:hypothetical protein